MIGKNNRIFTILIVDDDPICCSALVELCQEVEVKENQKIETRVVHDFKSCMETLENERVDVLLLDKNLNTASKRFNSLDCIGSLLHQQPSLKILVVTGDTHSQDVIRAIKMGAFGFIRKDEAPELLICQIQQALEVAESSAGVFKGLDDDLHYEMGAESKIMKLLLERAQAFSKGRRPVLILGETGTGKSVLARYIHTFSKVESFTSRDRPFIAINLSALPETLLERELFGSEKGAFTDSKERKQGYFELANGGTLFLDEIGEISPNLQVKLLKVIEEKSFYRLGGNKLVTSNFKLICATNRNLEEMVRQGVFREDLYMRISTFQVQIPPLRERKEDILPIIRAALPRWAQESEVQVKFEDLPRSLLDYLKSFSGRGNVRGLEQILSRIFALCPKLVGGKVDFTLWKEVLQFDLVPSVHSGGHPIPLEQLLEASLEIDKDSFPGLDPVLERFETLVYKQLREQCESSRELAALLKTSPATVSIKLKRFGLNS